MTRQVPLSSIIYTFTILVSVLFSAINLTTAATSTSPIINNKLVLFEPINALSTYQFTTVHISNAAEPARSALGTYFHFSSFTVRTFHPNTLYVIQSTTCSDLEAQDDIKCEVNQAVDKTRPVDSWLLEITFDIVWVPGVIPANLSNTDLQLIVAATFTNTEMGTVKQKLPVYLSVIQPDMYNTGTQSFSLGRRYQSGPPKWDFNFFAPIPYRWLHGPPDQIQTTPTNPSPTPLVQTINTIQLQLVGSYIFAASPSSEPKSQITADLLSSPLSTDNGDLSREDHSDREGFAEFLQTLSNDSLSTQTPLQSDTPTQETQAVFCVINSQVIPGTISASKNDLVLSIPATSTLTSLISAEDAFLSIHCPPLTIRPYSSKSYSTLPPIAEKLPITALYYSTNNIDTSAPFSHYISATVQLAANPMPLFSQSLFWGQYLIWSRSLFNYTQSDLYFSENKAAFHFDEKKDFLSLYFAFPTETQPLLMDCQSQLEFRFRTVFIPRDITSRPGDGYTLYYEPETNDFTTPYSTPRPFDATSNLQNDGQFEGRNQQHSSYQTTAEGDKKYFEPFLFANAYQTKELHQCHNQSKYPAQNGACMLSRGWHDDSPITQAALDVYNAIDFGNLKARMGFGECEDVLEHDVPWDVVSPGQTQQIYDELARYNPFLLYSYSFSLSRDIFKYQPRRPGTYDKKIPRGEQLAPFTVDLTLRDAHQSAIPFIVYHYRHGDTNAYWVSKSTKRSSPNMTLQNPQQHQQFNHSLSTASPSQSQSSSSSSSSSSSPSQPMRTSQQSSIQEQSPVNYSRRVSEEWKVLKAEGFQFQFYNWQVPNASKIIFQLFRGFTAFHGNFQSCSIAPLTKTGDDADGSEIYEVDETQQRTLESQPVSASVPDYILPILVKQFHGDSYYRRMEIPLPPTIEVGKDYQISCKLAELVWNSDMDFLDLIDHEDPRQAEDVPDAGVDTVAIDLDYCQIIVQQHLSDGFTQQPMPSSFQPFQPLQTAITPLNYGLDVASEWSVISNTPSHIAPNLIPEMLETAFSIVFGITFISLVVWVFFMLFSCSFHYGPIVWCWNKYQQHKKQRMEDQKGEILLRTFDQISNNLHSPAEFTQHTYSNEQLQQQQLLQRHHQQQLLVLKQQQQQQQQILFLKQQAEANSAPNSTTNSTTPQQIQATQNDTSDPQTTRDEHITLSPDDVSFRDDQSVSALTVESAFTPNITGVQGSGGLLISSLSTPQILAGMSSNLKKQPSNGNSSQNNTNNGGNGGSSSGSSSNNNNSMTKNPETTPKQQKPIISLYGTNLTSQLSPTLVQREASERSINSLTFATTGLPDRQSSLQTPSTPNSHISTQSASSSASPQLTSPPVSFNTTTHSIHPNYSNQLTTQPTAPNTLSTQRSSAGLARGIGRKPRKPNGDNQSGAVITFDP